MRSLGGDNMRVVRSLALFLLTILLTAMVILLGTTLGVNRTVMSKQFLMDELELGPRLHGAVTESLAEQMEMLGEAEKNTLALLEEALSPEWLESQIGGLLDHVMGVLDGDVPHTTDYAINLTEAKSAVKRIVERDYGSEGIQTVEPALNQAPDHISLSPVFPLERMEDIKPYWGMIRRAPWLLAGLLALFLILTMSIAGFHRRGARTMGIIVMVAGLIAAGGAIFLSHSAPPLVRSLMTLHAGRSFPLPWTELESGASLIIAALCRELTFTGGAVAAGGCVLAGLSLIPPRGRSSSGQTR